MEAPLISDSYAVVPPPSDSYNSPTNDRLGVAFKDEDGWKRISPISSSYLVSKDNMNWPAAKEYCLQKGGFLAELRTADEHLELSELLGDEKQDLNKLWIGLNRPYRRWETTGDLVTWANWKNQRHQVKTESCTALKVKIFRWVAQDCANNHGYKALCQKLPEIKQFQVQQFNAEAGSNHCIVKGVLLDLTNWLDKLENIESSADCHNICLKTVNCNFWSWDSSWKRCYLQQNDNKVVRDDYSESGTVLPSRGCNQEIKTNSDRQPRVETCSCVPRRRSSEESTGGTDLLNFQRSLPFNEDDELPEHLGRLIRTSVCRPGHFLSCSGDDEVNQSSKFVSNQPNITDCIVYDVQLSASDAMLTLYDVSNAETCHAFCLASDGCAYWTWTGNQAGKTCFLLRAETAMTRRVGGAAGTVLDKYGCRLNVIATFADREPKSVNNDDYYDENGCACELSKEDLIEGNIDPRYFAGSGRIVNEEQQQQKSATDCPYGFRKICKSSTVQYSPVKTNTKEKVQYSAKPLQDAGKAAVEKQVYQVQEWNAPLYKHIPVESLYGRALTNDDTEGSGDFNEYSTTKSQVEVEIKSSTESNASSRIRFED